MAALLLLGVMSACAQSAIVRTQCALVCPNPEASGCLCGRLRRENGQPIPGGVFLMSEDVAVVQLRREIGSMSVDELRALPELAGDGARGRLRMSDPKDGSFCVDAGPGGAHLVQFVSHGFKPASMYWDGVSGCVDVVLR